MALKKPSAQAARKKHVSEAEAEALANRIADRPYGTAEASVVKAEVSQLKRTSISLETGMLELLEDTALKNKREGTEPKSVSAIVRDALDEYFAKR
ncbi:TPA: hypothetical protein MB364_000796 [Klebsiella variicola subsp. variicola]|nr:hypothetical protein [Klebsiella variicola subsp. variicola]